MDSTRFRIPDGLFMSYFTLCIRDDSNITTISGHTQFLDIRFLVSEVWSKCQEGEYFIKRRKYLIYLLYIKCPDSTTFSARVHGEVLTNPSDTICW